MGRPHCIELFDGITRGQTVQLTPLDSIRSDNQTYQLGSSVSLYEPTGVLGWQNGTADVIQFPSVDLNHPTSMYLTNATSVTWVRDHVAYIGLPQTGVRWAYVPDTPGWEWMDDITLLIRHSVITNEVPQAWALWSAYVTVQDDTFAPPALNTPAPVHDWVQTPRTTEWAVIEQDASGFQQVVITYTYVFPATLAVRITSWTWLSHRYSFDSSRRRSAIGSRTTREEEAVRLAERWASGPRACFSWPPYGYKDATPSFRDLVYPVFWYWIVMTLVFVVATIGYLIYVKKNSCTRYMNDDVKNTYTASWKTSSKSVPQRSAWNWTRLMTTRPWKTKKTSTPATRGLGALFSPSGGSVVSSSDMEIIPENQSSVPSVFDDPSDEKTSDDEMITDIGNMHRVHSDDD